MNTLRFPGAAAWIAFLVLAAAPAGADPGTSAPSEEGPGDRSVMGDGVAAGAARDRAFAKASPRARRIARLEPLDVAALRAEDDAQRSLLGGDWKRWNRVGVVRGMRPVTVPPIPASWGSRAETLDDGSLVFRIEVRAPGATGLRVRFARCEVPAGSEITIHDADEPAEAYGPLRPDTSDGSWLGPTVFGSRAVVALRVPAGKATEAVRLTVDGVAQRYRPPEESSEAAATRSLPAGAHGGFRALNCMKSVACDADYVAGPARGVARYEFSSGGNVYLCSGALLADLDTTTQIPWFLTANHCVSTDKSAKTMEFFWDYRLPSCGGSVPSLTNVPRTLGATLADTTADSDCTLVRITGTLPSNRYFCGWTTAKPGIGSAIVGVHHPEGTHMRISYGSIDTSSANFHTVVWNDGVTAEGSSGSPIFNAQMQVVGQLCCGASYCNRPRDPDDYGRLDVSYPAILQPFLGNVPPAAGPDAWDPGDDTSAGATVLSTPTTAGITHGPHTLNGSDAADWFAADLEASVPYVFETTGAVRADVFADAAGTTTVASTTGGATGFSLVAVPTTSARHWVRVRRASAGVDANYQLQVLRQDTVPPKAVGALKAVSRPGGYAQLTWTDRARDETGYRVEFLGPAGWVRVADLPANTKRFKHRPGPGHQLYRVGPYDLLSTNWREVGVKVKGKPGLDAWDPVDDTGAGATSVGTSTDGRTETHELDRNDAADWFRIELLQGETWAFSTEGDGDTVGAVFAEPGGLTALAEGDDQEDAFGSVVDSNFRIEFTAPASGTYWIRVQAYPTTPRATYQFLFQLQ